MLHALLIQPVEDAMHVSVRHPIDVSAEVFWQKIYFDARFTERLHLDGLDYESVEIAEQSTDADGTIRYRLITRPKIQAPRLVRRALGEGIFYTEDGVFDPKTGVCTYQLVANRLSTQIRITGAHRTISLEADRCELQCTMDCHVQLPAIGGAVERFIAAQYKEDMAKQERFIARWIREHFS